MDINLGGNTLTNGYFAGIVLQNAPYPAATWADLMALDQSSLAMGGIYSITGRVNKTQIVCTADSGGSLNSTGLTLAVLHAYYTFWFNVSGGGSAPPVVPNQTAVEVDISTGASAIDVATALATAITANTTLRVSRSTGNLTITDPDIGPRINGDGVVAGAPSTSTGFSFTTLQAGSGSGGSWTVIDPTQAGTPAAFSLAGNAIFGWVQQTSSQSYVASSNNTVIFNNIQSDAPKIWDGLTQFKFPTPGKYLINIALTNYSTSTAAHNVSIYINGAPVALIGEPRSDPDGYLRFLGAAQFAVNAGDVLQIILYPTVTESAYVVQPQYNQIQLQQIW